MINKSILNLIKNNKILSMTDFIKFLIRKKKELLVFQYMKSGRILVPKVIYPSY